LVSVDALKIINPISGNGMAFNSLENKNSVQQQALWLDLQAFGLGQRAFGLGQQAFG